MMASTWEPFWSLTEAGARLRSGDISASELARRSLERIDRLDPRLGSYITVTTDRALSEAERADHELARGIDRGPLHGIPLAVKDQLATKGTRTTGNSRLYADFVPERDAETVERLTRAGSVLLGKLTMDELGYGGPVISDSLTPQPRNPWGTDHVTGGSSSGSAAAVAAGLCFGALGGDGGGSIRGPAAYCGIVGLKPTTGLVSRVGALPGGPLGAIGPMTRTVADCAAILQVIADTEPSGDALPPPDLAGLRFGVPRDWFDSDNGASDDVLTAFNDALETFRGLGAQVHDIDSDAFVHARPVLSLINVAEKFAQYADDLRTRPSSFGEPVRRSLLAGGLIDAADYITARRAQEIIRAQITRLMSRLDALLLPTVPAPAPRWDPETETAMSPNLAAVFNLVEMPAVTVPCGLSPSGLPIGLQIAGHWFEDMRVLSFAAAYEAAAGWSDHNPEIDSIAS